MGQTTRQSVRGSKRIANDEYGSAQDNFNVMEAVPVGFDDDDDDGDDGRGPGAGAITLKKRPRH